jgi:hypothetical protein
VLQSVALSESTQDQTWLYLDKLINGPIPVSVAISAILFIVYTLFRLMFGTADPNMGIFILGIGIVFVSSGTYVLWRAHRRRNWPATFCEVTRRSRTSMSISSGSSKDGWTLNYRYKVSGEEYTGSWFCKKWNPAKPFANQVPEDPVVVFYNPRNPEQSVVDRRAGASRARAEMLMGLALFVVGLIVWLS